MVALPEFVARFSRWLLARSLHRVRIVGQHHVPDRGPALLVCHGFSRHDRLLIGSCVQRPVRFPDDGREGPESVESVKRELHEGGVVGIVAEGAMSRAGSVPFKERYERMVSGLDVPVVPVHLDGSGGSLFGPKFRLFRRWPISMARPVTVAFGEPLPSTTAAAGVRLALQTLACDLAIERRPADESLGRQFVRTAKHNFRSFSMVDLMTPPLTFGRALAGALLLSRWAKRRMPNETNVGVLLPASVGGALANLGLTLAGKVPVNLNFTAGPASMTVAIDRCGIKTVVTSRRFLSKIEVEPLDSMVFLEDVMPEFSRLAKLRMFVTALLLPAWAINRLYVEPIEGDALATVIFSSGSTGIPKGVMLTHRNILANLDAIRQVVPLTSEDVIVGVLPLFHSFGFTGTLWLPTIIGFGVVYHPNPTDAKTIGELTGRYRGTLIITTPTFCSSYIRKCEPEQFQHLRYAIVGAEKLREPIAAAFKERFGIDLLEGYGCTELSPVVSVNLPDDRRGADRLVGNRPGTVGHPLPGIAVKVVDPVTGDGPLFDREGLLLVKGPNRMQGYLGEPEKTAEVVRDGWYATGDIAAIDDYGFIRITDRLSRFSKIAGEMVPHMGIEARIQAILGARHTCAVTSVPDEAKGERLVVFYTDPDLTAFALWERLSRTDLPRLWMPKREDLCFVESIPALGSGKIDLRAVRQLALERAR